MKKSKKKKLINFPNTITTPEMRDRFFLEEIIFRLENNQMDYAKTLLHDWMKEKVNQIPLTEKQRKHTVVKMQGKEWPVFYFKSEKALHEQIGLDD